ncbi:MAG TPA: hypothetical protein VN947_10290 [Polyangia bacterium]|nr:hypothetical protein [Polyangia bacterium]
MEVQFHRTDDRRYALRVLRAPLPPVEFQAFGYSDLLPHDLAHFIVESELGLTRGIFGFWAAGGDSGGAPHLVAGESRRDASRRRRKAERRDAGKLRRGERSDDHFSEVAAYICCCEWARRSKDPARSGGVGGSIKSALERLPDEQRRLFTRELFDRVCARMDELSARWSCLDVGESMSVDWTVTGRTPPSSSSPTIHRH